MRDADVIVIGAGPGGLAAAASAAAAGAAVILLERDDRTGGILNQCVHDGFGLVRYGAQLSGPEYAAKAAEDVRTTKTTVVTDTMVTGLWKAPEGIVVNTVSRSGVGRLLAGAVVVATGCRERTRGMIRIPGTRPAGIFTAGTAQNLINVRNKMVGRRVVILGTGDIGMIMARRLTLEGAEVLCAIEINREPQGLARNVQQCLMDYHIPLYTSHTVTDIIGTGRLEAVTMAAVDAEGMRIPGTEQRIPCDTLILSVGLIPENEVAETAGVMLAPSTNAIQTDDYLMSSVPGIFACGNCKGIMDLADYVSAEGEVAGLNAAAFALGHEMKASSVKGTNTAPKGLPAPGTSTCIFCPKGCALTIREDGKVTGNDCKRGLEFAAQERSDPARILTTTVRVAGSGELLPVRSRSYVPLSEMGEMVKTLSRIEAVPPVKAGDVIASGLGRSNAEIIAGREVGIYKGRSL